MPPSSVPTAALVTAERRPVRAHVSTQPTVSPAYGAVSGALGPARPLGHLPGKDGATAAREGVGVLLPEHVSHAAAGDDLQAAAALPHAERDL